MTVGLLTFKRIRAGLVACLGLTLVLLPNAAYATSDYDANAWQAGTPMPNNLYGAASAVSNGYVYEIGGYYNGIYYNTVSYAKLNLDGTVGSWQSGPTLPQTLNQNSSVAYNGYIYTLGGDGPLSVVYYAKQNANGSLGSWQTATAMPQGLQSASAVTYNGYVYMIGGYNGGALNTVYYAKFNTNGSLGSWQTGTTLPQGRYMGSGAIYNGYVYIMTGYDGSSNVATSYYAKLNTDGSVGTWQAGATVPQSLRETGAVANNGYVYLSAGLGQTGNVSTTYYAKLNPDGSMGSWQTSPASLPKALQWGTAVTYNGFIYYLGGLDIFNVASNTIYYSHIEGPIETPLTSSVSGSAVDVQTPVGTNLTCAKTQAVSNLPVTDGNYAYPLGLVSLCFTTQTVNNQVTLTFVTDLQPSQVTARNYNTLTQTFTTISGASVTKTTYNGAPALRLTYSVADNGALDIDPSDGAVSDPVGLAVLPANPAVVVNPVNAPDTGFGAYNANTSAWLTALTIMGSVSVGLIVLGMRIYRRGSLTTKTRKND